MKKQNPLAAGCAGCISLIFLGAIGIFVWAVISAASSPPPKDDTYLVGLDNSSTVAVSPSWDGWNRTAQLQAEQGPAVAGLYAIRAGAFVVQAGTRVHVLSRQLGQYGTPIAQVRLDDGRTGWINRASLAP